MWGFGGRYYWGSKGRELGRAMEGIVVVFAWMSSEEKHLKHYVDLYASLGWDSLICHSQFLNSFFPDKAALLAFEVLNELVEEIRIEPRPIVFAGFSGGPKACLYKVLQMIEGKCESQPNVDCYRLIKDCVAGHIYDSSPVDFVSEIGTRFVLHPSVLKMSPPPKIATWIANRIASGLDTLFINRFEIQRAEYWQTLYSSVSMGAPYLILCSEDDDLAPFQTICNFAQRIKELGADVTLLKWVSSPHVGHYRKYPDEYKAAVTQLFQKASAVYSWRFQQLEGERMRMRMTSEGSDNRNSGSFRHPKQVAINPSEELRRASAELADHFIVSSSSQCLEGTCMDYTSIQDESKESLIHLSSNPPNINVQGVLGEILYDICVPKNVDDWELRLPSSLHASSTSSASNTHSTFNPIKCITRSRL